MAQQLAAGDLGGSIANGLREVNNISAVVSASSAAETETEQIGTWKKVGGVFYLESCLRGYLLINTTLETQECRECGDGFYSVDPVLGCQDGICDARPCIECPSQVHVLCV